MELKFYDNKYQHAVGGVNPAITINAKSGGIYLNKAAMNELNIEPGTTITLAKDVKVKTDWYLIFGQKEGMKLALRKDGCLCVSSKATVADICNSNDFPLDKAIKMRITSGGIQEGDMVLYPIITKSAKF